MWHRPKRVGVLRVRGIVFGAMRAASEDYGQVMAEKCKEGGAACYEDCEIHFNRIPHYWGDDVPCEDVSTWLESWKMSTDK